MIDINEWCKIYLAAPFVRGERGTTLRVLPRNPAFQRGDNPSGAGESNPKDGKAPAPYGFSPRAPLSPLPHPLFPVSSGESCAYGGCGFWRFRA